MGGWKEYVGKKVFIISKIANHPWTGTVTDVDENFISIIDKYDKPVKLALSEITLIKEDE